MQQIFLFKCWDLTWGMECECHSVQWAKVFPDRHFREREIIHCAPPLASVKTHSVSCGTPSVPHLWFRSHDLVLLKWQSYLAEGSGPPRSQYRWISSPRPDLRCTVGGTSVQSSSFFVPLNRRAEWISDMNVQESWYCRSRASIESSEYENKFNAGVGDIPKCQWTEQ